MELIFEWVEADRGCIMLMDPATKLLQPRVRRTRQGFGPRKKITISKTILDYVIERNEGVITSDAAWTTAGIPRAASYKWASARRFACPCRAATTWWAIYIDTSTSPQQYIKKGGSGQIHRRSFEIDHRHRPPGGPGVEDTRYYSAMVQAERLAAVGQTIATLSHHIKNILQGIRGGSYLIEMGLSEHDEEVVGKGWKIVEKNQNKNLLPGYGHAHLQQGTRAGPDHREYQRHGTRHNRTDARPCRGIPSPTALPARRAHAGFDFSIPRASTARRLTW